MSEHSLRIAGWAVIKALDAGRIVAVPDEEPSAELEALRDVLAAHFCAEAVSELPFDIDHSQYGHRKVPSLRPKTRLPCRQPVFSPAGLLRRLRGALRAFVSSNH